MRFLQLSRYYLLRKFTWSLVTAFASSKCHRSSFTFLIPSKYIIHQWLTARANRFFHVIRVSHLIWKPSVLLDLTLDIDGQPTWTVGLSLTHPIPLEQICIRGGTKAPDDDAKRLAIARNLILVSFNRLRKENVAEGQSTWRFHLYVEVISIFWIFLFYLHIVILNCQFLFFLFFRGKWNTWKLIPSPKLM